MMNEQQQQQLMMLATTTTGRSTAAAAATTTSSLEQQKADGRRRSDEFVIRLILKEGIRAQEQPSAAEKTNSNEDEESTQRSSMKQQIRMIPLEELVDTERKQPSFGKLLDRVSSFLDDRLDDNRHRLQMTYQVDEDVVTLNSSSELAYAIRQHQQSTKLTLQATISPDTSSSSNREDVAEILARLERLEDSIAASFKKQQQSTDDLQSAIEALVESQLEKSYQRVSGLIEAAVMQQSSRDEADATTAPISHHHDNSAEEESESSSSSAEDHQPPPRVRYLLAEHGAVPQEFTCIHFPKIRLDPNRCASGLSIHSHGRQVTQHSGTPSFKCVYAKKGFAGSPSLCFWSVRVVINDDNDDDESAESPSHSAAGHRPKMEVMIGVSDGTASISKNTWPGYENDPGCCLYLRSGQVFFSNTSRTIANAALIIKQGTTIGLLLNLMTSSVTFYADGKYLGSPVALTASRREWFPVVALYELGITVVAIDQYDHHHHHANATTST